jgi:hypothetical protein
MQKPSKIVPGIERPMIPKPPSLFTCKTSIKNIQTNRRSSKFESLAILAFNVFSTMIFLLIVYKHIILFMSINFDDFFIFMAHNVPAVYDVLAARIRALRGSGQGRQNVPEQRRGNEA